MTLEDTKHGRYIKRLQKYTDWEKLMHRKNSDEFSSVSLDEHNEQNKHEQNKKLQNEDVHNSDSQAGCLPNLNFKEMILNKINFFSGSTKPEADPLLMNTNGHRFGILDNYPDEIRARITGNYDVHYNYDNADENDARYIQGNKKSGCAII